MPASALLLAACGYVATDYPACWEDDGDAENGPHVTGHPAYTEWRLGDHCIIVEGGVLADSYMDVYDDGLPF